MSFSFVVFQSLLVAAIVFGIFVLFRNQSVFRVRSEFINNDVLWRDWYESLPSYDEMVFHPKHWGRWNTEDWLNFVELTAPRKG